MDTKRYEVQPNETIKSQFKFKVVEVITYDSGHKSSTDYDFFVSQKAADKAAEELNKGVL